MGNGGERISGKVNKTDAPVAEDVWNDTEDELDIS